MTGDFSAAASKDGTAFFAVDGAVVSLDQELRELSRVTLLDGNKDAHDILPLGPRLYALDNIVHPVYTVLINTSDRSKLAVVARNEITSLYPHLDAQFVDPESHLWFVLQSSMHRGGFGQSLHTFSGDTGRRLGPELPVFFRPHDGDLPESPAPSRTFPDRLEFPSRFSDKESRAPEIRFHATSSATPCWTVLSDPHAELEATPYYMSRVSVEEGALVLDRIVDLTFTGRTKLIRVAPCGDLTFVLAEVVNGSWNAESSSIHIVVTQGEHAQLLYDGVLLEDAGASQELVHAAIWSG